MHRISPAVGLALLLCSLSLIVQATDRKKITLAFFADPNTNFYMKWGQLIYADAFNQLNIDFSYTVLPYARASKMLALGKIDGESARSITYGTEHPNLVRIEEPIVITHLSAFAYDPSIKINSWEDIQNSQYKVEYYRGSYLASLRLSQYVKPDRLSDSSSPIESLRKLLRGRIDIYIEMEENVSPVLIMPEFTNTHIQKLTRLEQVISYGYLHQRHNELAPKLAEVLRQMKSDGKFDTYLTLARQFIDTQTK